MTFRDRFILACLLTFVVVGMLGAATGYGLYYRSDLYRRRVEAGLTEFFSLPVTVGRVEPYTFHSRIFRDVQMWLPDRRDRIFNCPRAIWNQTSTGNGKPEVFLTLDGGTLSVGSEKWERDDYRHVLRAAFTRNLAKVNLRLVRLNGMDMIWPREHGRLTAEDVTGQIAFDARRRGEATLVSRSLNGAKVDGTIDIFARVEPTEAEFLPEVRLTVPTISLAALKLEDVVGQPIHSGRFRGTVTYRQQENSETIVLAGAADELDVAELTKSSPFGPVAGKIDLRIDQATVHNGSLVSIGFTGHMRGLDLAPLARGAGYPEISGHADVQVHEAVLEGRAIRRLSASGRVGPVPLGQITRRLAQGAVLGNLNIRLNAIQIENDEVTSMDADVSVLPPSGQAGTIDRELLLSVFEQVLGLRLPKQLLASRIEYVRMAAKLLVSDGRLRIVGTHGERGHTILVLRLLGQEVAIPAPSNTYDVRDIMAAIRRRAHDVDVDAVRRWWTPSSRPATAPSQ